MKLIFCVQISMKVSYKLILWFWLGCSSIPKVPNITSLLFLRKILRKKSVMKLIFCMQISIKFSYKLILWSLMGMVKRSRNSQKSLQCLYNVSKKKLEMKFFFWMQRITKVSPKLQHLGHQSFLQGDTIFIDGHCSQSTQSKKFAISLVRIRWSSFFACRKKLVLSFLTGVTRHLQSTQNRKLVIFLQYIQKKGSQLLLCSIAIQNIQIFYGGPLMIVITCFTQFLNEFDKNNKNFWLTWSYVVFTFEKQKRCYF